MVPEWNSQYVQYKVRICIQFGGFNWEEDGSFNCNSIVIAPPLSLSSALTFDILLPLFLIAPLTLILLGRQEKNKSRD